jgi:pyrimidine operon attenuation protein/uracil phosphoribosyltransferase
VNTTREILDAQQVTRAIRRMAGEIVDRHPRLDEVILVGIRTRGVPLARRLAAEIERAEGTDLLLGTLDITLYRDDLSTIAAQPVVKKTEFPGSIDGKILILCDDVLYTGRTIRAAMDALIDFGRPHRVELAVLVDRGHRELPIQADIVGRQVPTERGELVEVELVPIDGEDRVRVLAQAS